MGQAHRTYPEFEVALGARIRTACIAARMSQADLGANVGINYPQVQKNESGANRIAASTLKRLAATLSVHPGSFFEGEMSVPAGNIPEVRVAMRIAEALKEVRNPLVTRRILSLIEVLAEAEHPLNNSDETI